MASELDPKHVETPAISLINKTLVEAFNTPDSRVIISMPPQCGKSQAVSRRFPLWVLTQNPDTRITIASYETGVARRWGRAIRDDILSHRKELGLRIRDDVSAQAEWQLDGHDGGVFTAGIGSALTGRPSNLMLIDDPVKNTDEAASPVYRERAWNWWLETAQSRLHPGAPVVLIQTRWHADDLAGRLLAETEGQGWTYLNIPAQADHRPEKGESDPLGREPGEYLVTPTGMTERQWQNRKVKSGTRTWASLYQGRPTAQEGDVFPEHWERYYQPMWEAREDGSYWVPGMERDDQELVQSWDLAFKDTKGSDFVVGQVWLRVGARAFLLDMVRDRLNFTATCQAIQDLSKKWPQARAKFVEDKANGPAVINALHRTIPGLIPIEPEGSKFARASAVAPFVEAKNVVLPAEHLLPNVGELLTEAANFPNSAHDDTVDAMSQAVNRLLWHPLEEEGAPVELTEDDLLDQLGYSISPF